LAQATIVLQPENKETGAKTSGLWSCPPKDVRAENVKASSKNDALEVRLPKKPKKPRPKRFKVKVG
jgi:hypothetical protein